MSISYVENTKTILVFFVDFYSILLGKHVLFYVGCLTSSCSSKVVLILFLLLMPSYLSIKKRNVN